MISVSIVERKLDNHLDPASDVSYLLCIFLAKSLVFLQSYSWPVKKMEQKINRSNECTEEGRRNTCNNSLCDLRAEAYTWETREVDPPQSSHSPGNNREKNRDHRGCIKCVDTWYDNSTQQLNRNRHHHALNHQVGTIDIVLLRLWIEARISHAPSSGFLIYEICSSIPPKPRTNVDRPSSISYGNDAISFDEWEPCSCRVRKWRRNISISPEVWYTQTK